MTQGSKYSGKKVVVFFYREMPRNVTGDESKGLISNLLKIFQDRSRFEIVNGVMSFRSSVNVSAPSGCRYLQNPRLLAYKNEWLSAR
ncbi:MAG: hypothetical protein HA496_06405 [Thaumarchaeota archaeon]|nr:hypothetical protein [Nitrososphaerota archaeon]